MIGRGELGELLAEVKDTRSRFIQFKESGRLHKLLKNPNNEPVSWYLEESKKEAFELYDGFENEIQNESCPTASYWIVYWDLVQTPLE